MKNFLKDALSDGYLPSTTRIIVFVCIPLSLLIPLVMWAVLSAIDGKLLDFPASLAGFIVSIDTLILGTFHINKREETKIELK